MEKPFDEFGGWLRFFWLINILSLVLYCLSVIANTFKCLLGKTDFNASFVIIQLVFLLEAVFTFYILKFLKKRNPTNPLRIVYLCFAVAFVNIIGLTILLNFPNSTLITSGLHKSKLGLIIWFLYFIDSKRVKTFYGANAIPPKIKWFNKKTVAPDDTQHSDQNV